MRLVPLQGQESSREADFFVYLWRTNWPRFERFVPFVRD
jgi:hypothetical protein